MAPNSASRSTFFSVGLDLFRGAAAFEVLISHARVLFLKSMSPEDNPGIFTKLFFLGTSFGHEAVIVFFVLSGFLVGGPVVRGVRAGDWHWKKYATQRLSRLMIVLIPCLVLTVIWDFAESSVSAEKVANSDTAIANIDSSKIRENSGPFIFIGNLLFLQTVMVPSLGSNTALWSLANEFWYYVTFPLVAILLFGRPLSTAKKIALTTLIVAILFALGADISKYFVIWLLGAIASALPDISFFGNTKNRAFAMSLISVCMILIIAEKSTSKNLFPGNYLRDFVIGSLFAAFLCSFKQNRQPCGHSISKSVILTLSDFSFTLYIAHMPFLIFLRACFTYENAWDFSAGSIVKFILILAVTIVYSFAIYLLAERHTTRFRVWLDSRLGISKASLS